MLGKLLVATAEAPEGKSASDPAHPGCAVGLAATCHHQGKSCSRAQAEGPGGIQPHSVWGGA